MKLKTVTLEEIETMSFDDLAYTILKEKGKKMKIADIFKNICELLNMGEKAFEQQIGDFFTLLSTEKRFIQLEKGYWDLRDNHSAKISIKEVEEDLPEEDINLEEELLDEIDENEEEVFIDESKDIEDDEAEDDLSELVVIDDSLSEEAEL